MYFLNSENIEKEAKTKYEAFFPPFYHIILLECNLWNYFTVEANLHPDMDMKLLVSSCVAGKADRLKSPWYI